MQLPCRLLQTGTAAVLARLQTAGAGMRNAAAPPSAEGGSCLERALEPPAAEWILAQDAGLGLWPPGLTFGFAPSGKVPHGHSWDDAPCPQTSLRERAKRRSKEKLQWWVFLLTDTRSSAKAEAIKCWAEFKTTKDSAETYLKDVCR